MEVTSLFMFLVIGAIAGWVFGLVGVSAGGMLGSLIVATVGAAILLFLIGLIKK